MRAVRGCLGRRSVFFTIDALVAVLTAVTLFIIILQGTALEQRESVEAQRLAAQVITAAAHDETLNRGLLENADELTYFLNRTLPPRWCGSLHLYVSGTQDTVMYKTGCDGEDPAETGVAWHAFFVDDFSFWAYAKAVVWLEVDG